jgi:dihydropteroate synthase
MNQFTWKLKNRTLAITRPLVMGIVNVTPDSFSDGGRFLATEAAVAHGLQQIREGADLLDIGGESTRPGSIPVAPDEELRRVLPVISELARQTQIPISIDTSKAEVARRCLEAGASIVNDVTALIGDPAMPSVVKEFGAGAILMHMLGTPQTMHINPQFADVIAEIYQYLEQRLRALSDLGISEEQLATDPGVGFGQTHEHTFTLLRGLERFQALGRPLCLGASRKGFIGKLTGRPIGERQAGSVAVACNAMARGAAQILRVHDVAAHADAVRVFAALSPSSAAATHIK